MELKNEDVKVFICRVCLSQHTKELLCLFEPFRDHTIAVYIESLAKLEIKADDGLPGSICEPCFLELQAALSFTEKCQSSNKILQKDWSETDVPVDYLSKLKEEPPDCTDEQYLEPDWYDEQNSDETKPVKAKNVELLIDRYIPLEKTVQCHDCGEIFKSKCKLRVHWKKTHKPKSYLCNICKRSFKTIFALKNHQKRKSQGCMAAATEGIRIEGEGKSRTFFCNFCNYTSKFITHMKTHAVTHNGKRPYKCNLCTKDYTQLGSLIAHKEYAHNEYKLEITCQYCGKIVKGQQRIKRHLLTHSEERYQCDLCKKFLKTRKILIQHLIRHSGDKSKTCDQCGVRFILQYELTNHIRNVHGIKLKCRFCEYKTKSKKTLKKHEKMHSMDKLSCVICGFFFDNESKLRAHHKVHNEERNYPCPVCGLKFRKRYFIRQHMKITHKIVMPSEAKVDVKQED